MKLTQSEEFAVIKNEVKHIKDDVAELKKQAAANFTEIKDILKTQREEYAAKWVEKVSVGVLISVIAAISIFLITK
jgi:hypothetical protein